MDDLRHSIGAQLDERVCDLDDWQAVVMQALDIKAKLYWQAFLVGQKRDTRFSHSYRSLKYKEFQKQKNFEIQKNNSLAANSNNENGNQSGQALGRAFKSNSCLYKGDQQS